MFRYGNKYEVLIVQWAQGKVQVLQLEAVETNLV